MNDSDNTAARAANDEGVGGIMAWLDKNRNAILTALVATMVAAIIFTLIEDVLEDRSLAERFDAAEADTAEYRKQAAQDRQDAEDRAANALKEAEDRAANALKEAENRAAEDRKEAENRAAEDRKEANEYFRQINELLLTISKQGVENSVRLDHLEELQKQEE